MVVIVVMVVIVIIIVFTMSYSILKNKLENTLFPLEEIREVKKPPHFPYRGYHSKKNDPNKRLWMELYPSPKRRTKQPSNGEESRNNGDLFK